MNEDFSDCKFLNKEYIFYTFYDFVDNRYLFKESYDRLTDKQKEFYHYYVYANTHMTLPFKDRIWDYLNDDCDEDDLLKIVKSYKVR